MEKYVYSFNEGSRDMRNLLGGKGASLSEMTGIGLPVPFGFTVTTKACKEYYENECILTDEIIEQIEEKLTELENVSGKEFGSAENPLLVSIRTGSPDPTIMTMETILNLGLNDDALIGLIRQSEDESFALDCYRRFIQMYGHIVLGKSKDEFKKLSLTNLSVEEEKKIIDEYKEKLKKDLPCNPKEQLLKAIASGFDSWKSKESSDYRKIKNISDEIWTAVNIQAMVFGNKNMKSGTGTAFTRNPETGEKELYGKFIVKAQGEDYLEQNREMKPIVMLETEFSNMYNDFIRISEVLEKHFCEVQELEFVVEDDKLYMLQTQRARMLPEARVKISVNMAEEKLIDKDTAILRIKPEQIEKIISNEYKSPNEVINIPKCLTREFATVMSWADGMRSLKVRANADNPNAAHQAIVFGAEGIGLCRTEHMFLSNERMLAMRKFLMDDSGFLGKEALKELIEFQKSDFKEIFVEFEDKPVNIRLLDFMIDNILPKSLNEYEKLSKEMCVSCEELREKSESLLVMNSELGLRGCRLDIKYPEIAHMQAVAIASAAAEIKLEKNIDVFPEIMIPFIGDEREFKFIKKIVEETFEECLQDYNIKIDYLIGTMIEVPRAALIADKLAKEADFFSFGTNDLTQLVYGFAREDNNELMGDYIREKIFTDNPFETIDRSGVGKLMETAIRLGKQSRGNIKLGVSGKQGGDPNSISFFHEVGINYVSCDPRKIPVVKLAAAQAAIISKVQA